MRKFDKDKLQEIAENLKSRWEHEGNGAVVTIKEAGKQYECWVQEDGHYLIDDKVTIWDEEGFRTHTDSLEELAEVILGLGTVA